MKNKLFISLKDFKENVTTPLINITEKELVEILNSYLECAIWVEEDKLKEENASPFFELDLNIDNFTTDSKIKAYEDIKSFIQNCDPYELQDLIETNGLEQIGQSLWLSRNGHGSGFFDFGLDKLQSCAEKMGGIDLCLSANMELCFSNE